MHSSLAKCNRHNCLALCDGGFFLPHVSLRGHGLPHKLKVEMKDDDWAFPKPVEGMPLIASFQNPNIYLKPGHLNNVKWLGLYIAKIEHIRSSWLRTNMNPETPMPDMLWLAPAIIFHNSSPYLQVAYWQRHIIYKMDSFPSTKCVLQQRPRIFPFSFNHSVLNWLYQTDSPPTRQFNGIVCRGHHCHYRRLRHPSSNSHDCVGDCEAEE